MRKDQENRPNSQDLPSLAKVGMVAVGAVVLVGGGLYIKESLDDDKKEPSVARTLGDGESTETPEAAPSYASLHEQGIALNKDYFTKRQNGDSIDTLRKDLARLTMQKAKAYQDSVSDPSYSAFTVDEVGWVINLREDAKFDLDDPEDLAIGAALVDYYFQLHFKEELETGIKYYYPTQGGTYDVEENLLWLSDNMRLELGDVPPLLEVRNLENLAVGIRALDEFGINEPKKIVIKYGDFDNDENTNKDEESETLVARTYSYPSGEFYAKLAIGEYVVRGGGELLQKYSKMLDQQFADSGEITDVALTSSSYYGSYQDDYSELSYMISDYLYDGVGLRKRILYAQETGHNAEAKILQAKYDFIKNEEFNGGDISIDGKKKELFKYEVGDVVEIEDYEGYEREGIFLRETPTLEINPNRPSIGDYSKIQILEGPVVVTSENYPYQLAVRMWKVQSGMVSADGRVFEGYEERVGWVSEEWFAEKVGQPD